MKKYKVIVTCGNYSAPCLYVEAIDGEAAIKEAKTKSGLSRFNNFAFIPKEIN